MDFFPDQESSLEARIARIERSGVYLRRGTRINTSDYSVLNLDSTDSDVGVNTIVSGIIKKGSVPPTSSTSGFAATSAGGGAGAANLHIYWDGTNSSFRIIIERADGTRFVVPKGDLNVAGLNPSTTYYFLPFWGVYGSCNVGWIVGTVGSPKIAFTVNTDPVAGAKQNLQDREPLTSGYMSFVTAAAGVPSGGTSGGGGGKAGTCVMHSTDIEPLGGEMLVDMEEWSDWWRIDTANMMSLNCTPNHWLMSSRRGFVRADSLQVSETIITKYGESAVTRSSGFKRRCLKDSPHVQDGSLYWANGLLSHNWPKQNYA